MAYTTAQLLLRRWYAGVDVPEEVALEELERRGWRAPRRIAVLALLLPLILPERILVALDLGDPWEVGDTPTVAFSIVYSAWLVSLPVSIVAAVAAMREWLHGETPNWWPAWVFAGILLATSIAGLLHSRRSGRDATE